MSKPEEEEDPPLYRLRVVLQEGGIIFPYGGVCPSITSASREAECMGREGFFETPLIYHPPHAIRRINILPVTNGEPPK